MTEDARWNWLRGEIDAALDGFVGQLDGLGAEQPVPNLDWSVAELTAHLASLPGLYRRQHDIGAAFEAPDDWAQYSIDQRDGIPIDDLARTTEVLRSEVAGFLDELATAPDAPRWLYACRTTGRHIAGSLLAELIIHGQDLGGLTGMKPKLTTEQAAAALPDTMAIVPAFVDPERAAKVAGTYHMGFRGHGDWTFHIADDGSLTVEEGRPAKADARLSADPAAFTLVSLGRVNQFVPTLTGRIVAYGRKPWRLLQVGNLAVDGV